jgi:hypothetical protein
MPEKQTAKAEMATQSPRESLFRPSTSSDVHKTLDYFTNWIRKMNRPELAGCAGMFYFNSWSANVTGHFLMRKILCLEYSKVAALKQWFRSIAGIFALSELKLVLPKVEPSQANGIVFSWCTKSDAKNIAATNVDRYIGSFQDAPAGSLLRIYFPIASVDEEIEADLGSAGVAYFKRQKSYFAPARRIFLILKAATKSWLNWRDLVCIVTREYADNEHIALTVARLVNNSPKVTFAVFPYEAQPLQHRLIQMFQTKRIKTIGYIHSAIAALPTDFILREGAPDSLWVHGSSQARILKEHCGWRDKDIQVIDSIRYARRSQDEAGKFIYLPYYFEDGARILKGFQEILERGEYGMLSHLVPKIHPTQLANAEHIRLNNALENLFRRYADKPLKDEKRAYIVGATIAVLELLENGFEVVHVVEYPIFDAFSARIWKEVIVREITPGVYLYRLSQDSTLIRFAKEGVNTVSRTLMNFGYLRSVP